MALSKDRSTTRRSGRDFEFPVAAGAVIYAGALVVLDAGEAKPGATALNFTAVGRASARADNTGGLAGAINAKVERGVFQYANSAAGDEIALSDVGATAYIVDDETVAKSNGTNTRSAAGIIRDVDAKGVWVEI